MYRCLFRLRPKLRQTIKVGCFVSYEIILIKINFLINIVHKLNFLYSLKTALYSDITLFDAKVLVLCLVLEVVFTLSIDKLISTAELLVVAFALVNFCSYS